jgi:predicted RNA polymerase sigma factor
MQRKRLKTFTAPVHARALTADATDWGRIVATLIRLFGDFDLAEECAQEAFAAAVDQWRESGVPDLPRAWIIQTAKHKAIDRIRRQGNYAQKLESYAVSGLVRASEEPNYGNGEIPDDRLRLIFTCCHPALAPAAHVALTLRSLCGPRLSRFHHDHGPAPGACEGQDSRSAHPVRGSRRERNCRPFGCRPDCNLPRLQ